MTPEYLDRPAPGWFALDVMREKPRKWDWVALMVDVDPDDLKHCACDFPALFYVHPADYRPGDRVAPMFVSYSRQAQGLGERMARSPRLRWPNGIEEIRRAGPAA